MKRSSRVVLLAGILLAVVAFAAVIVLVNQRPVEVSTAPTTLATVYARTRIPLGTVITLDMLETRQLDLAIRPKDAYGDAGLVVGKTVRTDVAAGALITAAVFSGGAGGAADVANLLDPGLRAISVQVDQTTGVGTLINVGDRVDMVIAITADKFPQAIPNSAGAPTLIQGLTTSTKLILQNMKVIGTLVPPATTTGTTPTAAGTAFTGVQELVILAVTPQQAEVIKFVQFDASISLVLRSPKDFVDAGGNPVVPQPAITSGVILKTLIEQFGVLPPQVIQATNLPTAAP